jgi:hypothetical protein
VIAGGEQNLDGRPDAVVCARPAQLRLVQRKSGPRDAAGVQRVGLADAPVGAGVHPRGFDDGVSGICGGSCQPSAVRPRALDHPERVEIAAGATPGPRHRP